LSKHGKKYQFVVAGYVVMPEHIHLLMGEPKIADLSRVMQVLKQRVSLQCRAKRKTAKQQLSIFSERLPPAFWQPRSYDFNVRTRKKHAEKLNYMHFNPVRRGWVKSPELWRGAAFGITAMAKKGPSRSASNYSPNILQRERGIVWKVGHPPGHTP
jgi:REP-associated tyrosine transposase